MNAITRGLLGLLGTTLLIAPQLAPALDLKYGLNLRYRYEYFDRDADAATPPDATSKASTVRIGAFADASIAYGLGALIEFESVHQLGEDRYSIPTVPSQNIPGYPAILDPEGTEVNQAFLRWSGPLATTIKLGRQEYRMNDGRFMSNSAWRQNHISYDALTVTSAPFAGALVEAGYITRYLRVTGEEAINGRADMSSWYYNLGYTVKNLGAFKTYAVLLDFDDELTNSTHTFGVRFEGNVPLREHLRLLGTLDYAVQRDAAGNPNEVDADYRLVEAGVRIRTFDIVLGQSLLEGQSTANKLATPMAHPFNGWTELFASNPSLGASDHGLDARYVKLLATFPRLPGLSVAALYYDYRPDTGHARYGSEVDIEVQYNSLPIHKNLSLGWRFGRYDADQLFSDALRTSMFFVYAF